MWNHEDPKTNRAARRPFGNQHAKLLDRNALATPREPTSWHVYPRAHELSLAEQIEIGDKVLFRESLKCVNRKTSERITHRTKIDGKTETLINLPDGAGTIVGIANVVKPVAIIPKDAIRYHYGTDDRFDHWVECSPLQKCSYSKYADLLSDLELNPALPATKFVLYRIDNIKGRNRLLARLKIPLA